MKYHLTVKSTKNLDINHHIFKSYIDPTYIVKLTKLNRPAIIAISEFNEVAAIAVLNKNKRFVKLCLLIVDERYKNQKIGNTLIRVVQSIFEDTFFDADVLYTVCPHQFNTDAYQNLLIKNGFQVSTIKANGDIVYTYAKSI